MSVACRLRSPKARCGSLARKKKRVGTHGRGDTSDEVHGGTNEHDNTGGSDWQQLKGKRPHRRAAWRADGRRGRHGHRRRHHRSRLGWKQGSPKASETFPHVARTPSSQQGARRNDGPTSARTGPNNDGAAMGSIGTRHGLTRARRWKNAFLLAIITDGLTELNAPDLF